MKIEACLIDAQETCVEANVVTPFRFSYKGRSHYVVTPKQFKCLSCVKMRDTVTRRVTGIQPHGDGFYLFLLQDSDGGQVQVYATAHDIAHNIRVITDAIHPCITKMIMSFATILFLVVEHGGSSIVGIGACMTFVAMRLVVSLDLML